MSEESNKNEEQDAQTTDTDSNVDYKTLYHQEVKNSKSQRGKKQELEAKLEQLELKSEEDRQAKGLLKVKKMNYFKNNLLNLKHLRKSLECLNRLRTVRRLSYLNKFLKKIECIMKI